ncbi:tryptophan synthase subunit alpha [Arsenophonus nasoniae]|uniref:Tryptophan synthase alpha chain n=1 Tax=Arsenophonus nasoniae TaxID=638 RepID=A0AA95K005_9GAMM|nr:tryptophan synthase subunit alpha [Arsenophonus nasoniae]WGL94291.1 tryptophan synthase subunit alpha [Arsenophonus nasoniae]
MERYQQLFKHLHDKNQGAFVPFVTLGDPNAELSLKIIDTLIEAQADALEIGIPFSDPLADGPTIQKANLLALNANITPTRCFELLSQIREKHPLVPIGLLVYANLVFSNGIDNFYAKCQHSGIDSVLIADVPMNESDPFRISALRHNIAPIFICPPNADEQLLRKIALYGRGYTYLLSRSGVTGTEKKANIPVSHLLTKLQDYHAAPPLLGFGIAEAKQVTDAIKNGVAGAISGSAVVKLIETYHQQPDALLTKLKQFVSQMKMATHK